MAASGAEHRLSIDPDVVRRSGVSVGEKAGRFEDAVNDLVQGLRETDHALHPDGEVRRQLGAPYFEACGGLESRGRSVVSRMGATAGGMVATPVHLVGADESQSEVLELRN